MAAKITLIMGKYIDKKTLKRNLYCSLGDYLNDAGLNDKTIIFTRDDKSQDVVVNMDGFVVATLSEYIEMYFTLKKAKLIHRITRNPN